MAGWLASLFFKNGKMICAGAKREAHLKKGLKIVENLVGRKKRKKRK